MFETKQVRLTRSILLGGQHIEEGSIQKLPQELADDLIAQGSAVQLNLFYRLFMRIRLVFVESQTQERRERN